MKENRRPINQLKFINKNHHKEAQELAKTVIAIAESVQLPLKEYQRKAFKKIAAELMSAHFLLKELRGAIRQEHRERNAEMKKHESAPNLPQNVPVSGNSLILNEKNGVP